MDCVFHDFAKLATERHRQIRLCFRLSIPPGLASKSRRWSSAKTRVELRQHKLVEHEKLLDEREELDKQQAKFGADQQALYNL